MRTIGPFWDFEVEFSDFASGATLDYCTQRIRMKNLLAQEWEPLPDGLLVMRADVFAARVPAKTAFIKKCLLSKYFSK